MLERLPDNTKATARYSRTVAKRILLALSERYDIAGYQHDSTCSIGVTLFNKCEQNMSDVLKQADLAMYQARASGRNTVCFFDPAMQALVTANASLNTELRESLRLTNFAVGAVGA